MTTQRRQNARWYIRAAIESPFYFMRPLSERLHEMRMAVLMMEMG